MIYDLLLVTSVTSSIDKAHQFFTGTQIFELESARYNLGCVTLRGKEMGDGGVMKMLLIQRFEFAEASTTVGCGA
jgi:hypothetical protein